MSTKQLAKFETSVKVPEKVKVNLKKNILEVEGPLGKTFKNFKKIPVILEVKDDSVFLKAKGNRKKDYAILNTAKSLVRELCKGVSEGYTVKMKVVYAHFPITVKPKESEIRIENFQGERAPRVIKIHGATKVVAKGDEVIMTGPVLTDVTQTAANVQQGTRIKNKDHRVFLDGIYVFSKSSGIEK